MTFSPATRALVGSEKGPSNWAFVTVSRPVDAANALVGLAGHRYGGMVLGAEAAADKRAEWERH